MNNYGNFFNPNQNMINQLLRQKDNIENMLNQYSQPQQAPVQNIINTGSNTEFEAKILADNEEVENIYINKRTMFLDKKNRKVMIKELDGNISEEYEIVIPLDEKDKRILDLENKLKEMEEKINDKFTKYDGTIVEQQKPDEHDDTNVKSSTKAIDKSNTKSAK